MCFHRLHRSFPYKISPFVFHGKKIWSEWVNDGCFYFWVNYHHGLCYCSEVNIEREIHQLSTQQSDMFTFWSLSVTRPPLCSSTQTGCISLANLRALESRSQNIWGFLQQSQNIMDLKCLNVTALDIITISISVFKCARYFIFHNITLCHNFSSVASNQLVFW